ncbi:unnamed protein product [Phytophthora lilii]|uniref:Unnamed protein product n=1 Tax=Phytophthora lilii TaxID=2077276 RepID=A0A9W6TFD1_9STRA|nr:unnamed protein product [Phytophthora lilii]
MSVVQLGVLDQALHYTTNNDKPDLLSASGSSQNNKTILCGRCRDLSSPSCQVSYANSTACLRIRGLVIAEYSELMSAITYCLYVLIAYHMPNSKYSMCLIGLSDDEHWESVIAAQSTQFVKYLHCFSFHARPGEIWAVYSFPAWFRAEKILDERSRKNWQQSNLVFILHTVHQGTS